MTVLEQAGPGPVYINKTSAAQLCTERVTGRPQSCADGASYFRLSVFILTECPHLLGLLVPSETAIFGNICHYNCIYVTFLGVECSIGNQHFREHFIYLYNFLYGTFIGVVCSIGNRHFREQISYVLIFCYRNY